MQSPLFLQRLSTWLLLGCLGTAGSTLVAEKPLAEAPNVLLIAVDDLNDWVGGLNGHPQAQTPNIDRLAAKGMLFANAHCQSPVCNPSRASLMSSLYPETTGVYFLSPSFANSPKSKGHTMMPVRFSKEGYEVSAVGKLFHSKENSKYFDEYGGSHGGFGPYPKKKLSPFKGVKLWDWGVFPESDEGTPDQRIASWAEERLSRDREKPFFMGVGFYRPHVPQYAPQQWFDMYPAESLQLPAVMENDLADISPYARALMLGVTVAPEHDWVLENEEWEALVQSYLASVSFVDHKVGKVLDALENSDAASNTYVVLFSDHGFHLGEKERWAKRSLWEDSTHVPMIIAGPGIAGGQLCEKPVELLDIYPTLLELAGMAADPSLEGDSLVPLLENPNTEWPHIARSSFGLGNVSIRSERFRYIRYKDGSEEFYDHWNDPHEWHNLIKEPEWADVIAEHRAFYPEDFHPILGKGSTGHKAYNRAQ
ncbi:MAG: sulfatase [Opitutales bacterium]